MVETYYQIFLQDNEEKAKSIILTPSEKLTTDERWETETAFLSPYLLKLPLGSVIDYGCGIGRLSKVFVENGYHVFGVDISPTMRHQAEFYVRDDNFSTINPVTLKHLYEGGFKIDSAVAVWSLQHVLDVENKIEDIANLLKDGALFLVVDTFRRYIPALQENDFLWVDDNKDITVALNKFFTLEFEERVPDLLDEVGYIRIYKKI